MEGETISLNYSSESTRSCNDSISILVVDDDITCLSIVAAILKKFKCEVVTVKHPNDALCTLRIKGDAFDLVVSDVHMPDMNGFELQEAIAHEFNLPVVLMSADNKEGVASKGLESGAAFFISKPVSPDDLRDLWQFAAMKKKNKVVINEEAGNYFPGNSTSANQDNADEMPVSASTVCNKKDSKRKSPSKEGFDERRGDNAHSASTKRPKVIWTNTLHNRFLEAIRSIGLDRCVPKKILEVMNVPGLTRENVASHLQKYRIFLRRVSDASFKIHFAEDKGLSRNLGSGFASSGTSHSIGLSKPHYQNPGNFRGKNCASFPDQGASPSSLIGRSEFGKNQLISITGSLRRPNIRHDNLIHQNGRQCVRLVQNNYQMSPLFQGHLFSSSLEGHTDNFGASALGSTRVNLSMSPEVSPQVGTSNIISSLASTNFAHRMNQTNYVGHKISSIKHLAESGSSKEYESLNCYDGTINLHSDEFQNNSANAAALPSDNILNLDQPAGYLGASSCYVPDYADGKRISDVVADYQNLLFPSSLPLLGNLENEELIHEYSAFSPIYDLPKFDIMATQQSLGESGLDNNFSNQVNIQNQEQPQVQGLTNSMEISTTSEFNKALLSPNYERDDDDYLESLLAFDSFGEDQFQNLDEI